MKPIFKKEDKIEIASVVVSFLIIMAILCLSWIFGGCTTTKRHAAETEQRSTSMAVATTDQRERETAVGEWVSLTEHLSDSIATRVTIDSLVSADGARAYGISIDRRDYNRRIAEVAQKSDSLSREKVKTDSLSVAVDEEQHAQESAKAEKSTWPRPLAIGLAIFAILAIGICVRMKM